MTVRRGGVAGLLALVLTAPAAADRLLLEAPGLAAGLAQPFRCGEPARVTVEAARPDLFHGESPELQGVIDAVHAMLSFECPDLGEIQVHGLLKGLPDPVYRGIAGRDTRWLLQPRQTVQSGAAPSAAPAPQPGAPPATAGGSYTVAGLAPGMSVDEARAAVSGSFGVTPEYDSRQGVLTMQAPTCPQGGQWGDGQRPPQPGWKCLRAWFTDAREARLYLLELVQVVPRQGMEAVERALIGRFGPPVQRSGPSGGPSGGGLHLAWGDAVTPAAASPEDAPRPAHVLEAAIEPMGEVAVTTVTLYEPTLGPGAPPAGGLDLKL